MTASPTGDLAWHWNGIAQSRKRSYCRTECDACWNWPACADQPGWPEWPGVNAWGLTVHQVAAPGTNTARLEYVLLPAHRAERPGVDDHDGLAVHQGGGAVGEGQPPSDVPAWLVETATREQRRSRRRAPREVPERD